MMLAPDRFVTSSARAGWPLIRAKRVRVFEGAPDGGHIAEGHDRVAAHLDRHRHHVLQVFDQARHLEHDPADTGFDGARRDQAVVALDLADQLVEGQVVGLEHGRVDQDFQKLEPLARRYRPPARPPDLRSLPASVSARSFRVRSGTGPDRMAVMIGKSAVLISVIVMSRASSGRSPCDAVGRLAHLVQRFLDVAAGGEFKLDAGEPFGCIGLHLSAARRSRRIRLPSARSAAAPASGADPVEPGGDIEQRQRNLRVGLLGIAI